MIQCEQTSDTYDVIIVGTGVAGLMTALSLPKHLRILMVTKQAVRDSNSYLAQGGVSVLRDHEDYMAYYMDTLRAGHYENCTQSVGYMIRHSREVIEHAIAYGMPFDTEEGALRYTKEGGHSQPRIVHYKDQTGKMLMETLIAQVERCDHITLKTYTQMIDWQLGVDKRIEGVVLKDATHTYLVYSDAVVLATGGIGGCYEKSTNYPHITGDSFKLAEKYGVTLQHMDYVQIHPTTLYSQGAGRCFLISEAVRGEGGILLNHEGERFVDELLPRDKVCEAIWAQMRRAGTDYVYLSFEKIPKAHIYAQFPSIYERCLEEGYDVTREPIPVVPAQHYLMGGIAVGLEGKTSMRGLYAVGEVSCTGVHGKNRLASNSLLEAMVYGERVAETIRKCLEEERGQKHAQSMG